MQRLTNQRGFSLIEVVMVMVILSVVAVIAMPRFAGAHAHYRAKVTARRIAADLELARSLARAQSQNRAVTFDLSAQTYTLTGVADPDHPSATYTVSLGPEHELASLEEASFGGSSTVTFDGFGKPSAGGQIVVASSSHTFRVQVDSTTGRITLDSE